MRISLEEVGIKGYLDNLAKLLGQRTTRIYLDTSVLMWLTHIGPKARAEFFSWVDTIGPKRVHVPTWSVHELNRHLVESGTKSKIVEAASDIQSSLRRAYPALVPSFCEPINGAADADLLRADARAAFSRVLQLASDSGDWDWSGAKKDVANFANRHVISHRSLFAYFDDIGTLTENRYTSRVPPGFQDRGKKEGGKRNSQSAASDDASQETIGSNKSGDLIIWKEILDHVRRQNRFRIGESRVRSIVILTNDGKNDWVQKTTTKNAAGLAEAVTQNANWEPVPIAHPMLLHEALSTASVSEVAICTGQYLGALFAHTTATETAFSKAAVQIALGSKANSPFVITPKAKTPKPAANTKPSAGPIITTAAAEQKYFDGLCGSGAPSEREAAEQVVSTVLDIGNAQRSLSEILDAEASDMALLTFAWLGRLLCNAAAAKANGAQERLVDLCTLLATLPHESAEACYAGISIGTVLDKDNAPRTSLPQAAMELLVGRQKEAYAMMGHKVVDRALKDHRVDHFYLPNAANNLLKARVETEARENRNILTGLFFGDKSDVLEQICPEEALRCRTMFAGKEVITVEELITTACRLYGIPRSVVTFASRDKLLALEPEIGFASPQSMLESEQ